MRADFDVIVVGSGPAGVSATFPLVEAGLKVLLVDGGRNIRLKPPAMPYLVHRAEDNNQWEWMVGRDYHSLLNSNAVSPKLRVPTLSYVFEKFKTENNIETDNFIAIGSLAPGGLTNAWGCGVARLSHEELADYPFNSSEILISYERVSRRIGISGGLSDDLSDYFGLDDWADPPIALDTLCTSILDKYEIRRSAVAPLGFKLGRPRVAVLSQNRDGRKACDLSGNCLWGCHRQALYSATSDIELLKKYPNLTYRSGFVIDKIASGGVGRTVMGTDESGPEIFTANKIVLAAGTLATTRLALQALHYDQSVPLHSCPIAAFMLWVPLATGNRRAKSFGLGQLSFTIELQNAVTGFGSLFNTTGVPIAEFLRYMPFCKRYGIDFLKSLLSSCAVGNLFLPGKFSTTRLVLHPSGSLHVTGDYRKEMLESMNFAEQKLRKSFWKIGAILLPGSFTVGAPGGDIHYACSLPMRARPSYGETDPFGQLHGLNGVYIADGASLPSHSEKSHTLTIMANADRIGKRLAMEFGVNGK